MPCQRDNPKGLNVIIIYSIQLPLEAFLHVPSMHTGLLRIFEWSIGQVNIRMIEVT